MAEPRVLSWAALFVAACAAIFDLRRGRLPNWLTYGALALAPLLRAVLALTSDADTDADEALFAIAGSLGGAALSALVPAVLYRAGALGGGDVKLLAAIGALLAPIAGLEAETYGFLVLAACIPLKLTFDGKLVATAKGTLLLAFNALAPARLQRPVPNTLFGSFRVAPAMFVGVLLVTKERW